MGITSWLYEPDNPWVIKWPDREKGPYIVRLGVAMLDGRPEILSLQVTGWEGPGFDAIRNSTVLRELSLPGLLDELLVEVRRGFVERDLLPFDLGDHYPDEANDRAAIERNPRGGRPRLYSDEHFRQVADIYMRAAELGLPPTDAVKVKWRVSKSTAAKWVARARNLNYLPETTQGRAKSKKEGD
jgi:hypothetical protein